MDKLFKIEKTNNSVYIVSNCGLVWYFWNAEEFTNRKLSNAIAKLKAQFCNHVVFEFVG